MVRVVDLLKMGPKYDLGGLEYITLPQKGKETDQCLNRVINELIPFKILISYILIYE